jgi:hypothetical protein
VTLHLVEIDPDPIEVDPRPCECCGLTIDRHKMVDEDGEGPVFFCADPDEMTLLELERRAELRRQEEVADILARWEALDVEIASRRGPLPPREPAPYSPAASTVNAFWYVVGLADPERFKAWLAARPDDAPFLLKLLEGK